MKSAVGYADLARVLRVLPEADRLEAAELLGFRRLARVVSSGAGTASVSLRAAAVSSIAGSPAARASFFRVEAAAETRPAEPIPPPPDQLRLTREDLRSQPRAPLPSSPLLASWSMLSSRLQGALHAHRLGRDPNIGALVLAWARGEYLQRLPRRMRRTWTALAEVWIDRSCRLTPFWCDQDMVIRRLVDVCGAAAIRLRVLDAAWQAELAAWHGEFVGSASVDPAVPVLVLGDLACFGAASDRACWHRTARRLRRDGVRLAALVPGPVARWDRALAHTWNAMPWERPAGVARGTPDARAAALLRLVAPTALAQPGLLRALRRLLPAAEADASTEVDVWRHADVQAADVNGLALRPEAARRWRDRFATEVEPPLRAEVRRLIDAWHGHWRGELIHAETLAWIAHGLPEPPGGPDEARAFVAKVAATLAVDDGAESRAVVTHYGRHLTAPLPDQAYTAVPALATVWSLAYDGVAGVPLPSTIDPDKRAVREQPSPHRWVVRQRGDALVLDPAAADGSWADCGPGSPVATLTVAKREIWVQRGDLPPRRTLLDPGTAIAAMPGERIRLRSDCGEVTLAVWERATWAVAFGRDRYGLWAAFEVQGVEHRMRWIPPGRFLMGSPPSEDGRWPDEGPQHEVTITQGYWLGEAPVTQALWVAVMGKNPSRFVSDDRPVETVSWADCQTFIGRLNKRLDGLETRLPTEAEWERACRAGTTTATWVGDVMQPGENDAPELDAIAWYSGNSGVDFELDDGHDSSNWPEKQHPHTRAGTHAVGRKAPNPYGLYDMLGNVFEWCQDTAEDARCHPYTSEAAVDPVSRGQGPDRINRGGSWDSDARYVRAVYRSARPRGRRIGSLGFRLAGGEPDRDVLDLVARGDMRGALTQLMVRYGDGVYRYCFRMLGDGTLADEVRQEVFVEAYRDLELLSRRSTVKAWLFTIARNRVLDTVRSPRRGRRNLVRHDTTAVPEGEARSGEPGDGAGPETSLPSDRNSRAPRRNFSPSPRPKRPHAKKKDR
jgi:RNA polymerase sigma factor (sigma-70 family)